MIGYHFRERISRLYEIGFTREQITKVVQKGLKFVGKHRDKPNSAILVETLDSVHYCKDGSNGDEVWIVTQGGMLATLMLRCSYQEKLPQYFHNVDEVVLGYENTI